MNRYQCTRCDHVEKLSFVPAACSVCGNAFYFADDCSWMDGLPDEADLYADLAYDARPRGELPMPTALAMDCWGERDRAELVYTTNEKLNDIAGALVLLVILTLCVFALAL